MTRRLIIASLVVLLLLAVPIVSIWLLYRGVPPADGNFTVAGLEQPVTISLDEHGVPYIEAHTDTDAFIAQGYATARDRLFQMDVLRRRATGHMSEVFGSGYLQSDRLTTSLGLKDLAYRESDKLSPPAKAALESYARGVNSYIAEYSGRLPVEFTAMSSKPRTWRPEDSLAILKYLQYQMDESWRLDDFRQRVSNKLGEDVAAQLFADNLVAYGLPGSADQKPPAETDQAPPSESHEKPPAKETSEPRETPHADKTSHWPPMPGAAQSPVDDLLARLACEGDLAHQPGNHSPLIGSTTWAVPAAATATGGALLACNKDGPLTAPCEWYLTSINSPGMHVAGACVPGVPSIVVGRSENLCWGSSALKADVQDIYLEKFKSQFDTKYQTSDGWVDAVATTELIPVRFGRDVEHKVLRTIHGPVLLRVNDAAVSLAWTGFQTDHPAFDAIYQFNRAISIDECVRILNTYNGSPMIFVFADRYGNIACHGAGLIPVRSGGSDGTRLNPGWEKKDTWNSYVPYEKLPIGGVLSSKSSGADKTPVIAANQRLTAQTVRAALPRFDASVNFGHQWAAPYRANRLLSVLRGLKEPVTLADMVALAGDHFSMTAGPVAEALHTAGTADKTVDRNGLQAIDLLSKWDGQLVPDGIEGSIYEAFLQTFARRLLEPRLGREMATEYLQRWPLWLTFVQSAVENKPAQWLAPEERNYDGFFLTSLTQGLKSLRITFDTTQVSDWLWGKRHLAIFRQTGISGSWFAGWSRVQPAAVGGSGECIDSCDVAFDPSALSYAASSGPVMRMIVDMADRSKFYQCLSTGQSGLMMSPHRTDQLKAWKSADFIPIAYSTEQLVLQSKHRIVLEPGY